jgi:polar amino acid transport system substrate-binding protein
VDLARAMGELLGVEIAFVLEGEEEQAAAEAAVDAGQEATTHIAMGAFVDDETYVEEWGVDFVNHYRDGLGVMSENPENSPRDLNELCGLAITTFESSADSMRDRVSHCTRPTPVRPKDGKDEMAEAIAGGEADVAVLNYSDTAYWAGEEGRDYGLGINLAEGEGGYRGIAVPAGQEELSDAIYKALLELMNDGTYNDLLDRWHIGQAALDGPDVNHH